MTEKNIDTKKIQLTDEEKKELELAWQEITEEAKKVVDDYVENPSEESGSVVQIHENSPFLDKAIKGTEWKKEKKLPNLFKFGELKKKDKKENE